MARQKKDSGPVNAGEPPAKAHNDLTDDQKRSLFLQGIEKLKRLQAALATATADVRNHRKQMKSEGFPKVEVDYALYLDRVSPEEAIEQRSMEARVARWKAHPVGHQAELFGDGVDRTPSEDVAFEEGKTAGLAGLICKLPEKWAEGSPQGQRWFQGWAEGQKTLLEGGINDLHDKAAGTGTEGGGLPGAEGEANYKVREEV